jgi:hypothetical protein
MTVLTSNSLDDLDPEFQPVARAIIDSCNAQLAPSSMKAIVTFRSAADQGAAKAAGLSKAAAGQSPHNCFDDDGNPAARAFDFAVFGADGAYVTRGEDARYAQCGQIAVAVGNAQGMPITWGGCWTLESDRCEPDFDHIEMRDWKTA